MEEYLASSIFIADINNEREQKNATYASNFEELEKLVLVRFTEDQTGGRRAPPPPLFLL